MAAEDGRNPPVFWFDFVNLAVSDVVGVCLSGAFYNCFQGAQGLSAWQYWCNVSFLLPVFFLNLNNLSARDQIVRMNKPIRDLPVIMFFFLSVALFQKMFAGHLPPKSEI